jgi:hypothetical protein
LRSPFFGLIAQHPFREAIYALPDKRLLRRTERSSQQL